MRICIFEDRRVGQLAPLNLTRPTFDLLCGRSSLHDKQIRQFPCLQIGALVRSNLVDLCRAQHPGWVVNEPGWLASGPLVLINSRWLPGVAAETDSPARSVIGMCAGEPAFAIVGPEQAGSLRTRSIDECLAGWQSGLPQVPTSGQMAHHLWDLVQWNGRQIGLDASEAVPPEQPLPATLAVVGPRVRVFLDPCARLDPLVVLDTTGGPVIIERDALVTAFSRLEGPCVIGAGSHVLGAKIRAGTTLGPHCRIGGEIEASIVQGYTNKCHDGFLGHSYLGEWVNFGAGTCNSDLRNDYGEVSVVVDGVPVPTGQRKVGCFVGDHTKTGLNVVLNTGTSIGAFCNVLPSGDYPAKYLPSFSNWWRSSLADNADVAKLLTTASTVMGRRGCSLTTVHSSLYRNLYEQSGTERRRAAREAEQRRLRRSA